jgi:hypothetical protein
MKEEREKSTSLFIVNERGHYLSLFSRQTACHILSHTPPSQLASFNDQARSAAGPWMNKNDICMSRSEWQPFNQVPMIVSNHHSRL